MFAVYIGGTDPVSAILGVLGVAGVAGAAIAVLTSRHTRTTLDIYKEENAAQAVRIGSLELTEHECQTKLAALQRSHDALRDLVTGASAIKELSERESREHRLILDKLDRIEKQGA